MSKLPYMPFFVGDYLSDTADLSIEAHGAYCLILFYTWKKKGWLEDDDKKMKRILRVHGTAWKRIKKEIEPYFELSGWLDHIETTKVVQAAHERYLAGRKAHSARALPTLAGYNIDSFANERVGVLLRIGIFMCEIF